MSPTGATRRARLAACGLILVAALLAYGLLAYVALPAVWTHYEHQKGLAGLPMVTRTAQGIPGDPMNVGVVGTQEDVLCALHAADWHPADPITLRSSLEIVGSVVLDRPYPRAPVSPLFYDGRREDPAFEKAEGGSADRRHHVRFWKVLRKGQEGRSVWLGAATFDRGVGFNRFNGQFTHHIGANIDAERDFLTEALKSAEVVEAVYEVTGIGPTLKGVNGEGDPYHTDGEIKISRLVEGCGTRVETPLALTNPPVIDLKNFVRENVMDALVSLRSPRASQDSE
jgi:hypothetical protein